MYSMFDTYREEFVSLTTEISRNISHATTYENDPTVKLGQLRKTQGMMGQAEDLLKQMEIETRSTVDREAQKEFQTKVLKFY